MFPELYQGRVPLWNILRSFTCRQLYYVVFYQFQIQGINMMVLPAAVDIFTIEFFIYHFCERDKKKTFGFGFKSFY